MAVIIVSVDRMTTTAPGALSPPTPTDHDGRHDFDFFFGTWSIHNRKLVRMLDPECDDWAEFSASSRCEPVCDGWGNTDVVEVSEVPDSKGFKALTLRLFDPERGVWQIWWTSSSRPGRLDPPVEGVFADGRGVFECHDEIDGTPIEVRFIWGDVTADSARWEQEFSFDGGDTWVRNWVMDMTRSGGPAA